LNSSEEIGYFVAVKLTTVALFAVGLYINHTHMQDGFLVYEFQNDDIEDWVALLDFFCRNGHAGDFGYM